MKITDYEDAFKLWSNTTGMGLRSLDDSRKGIKLFLCRNPNTNFTYRIDNELVGVILSGHDGRRGYIYHAVVNVQFQKQGIGKKLVNSCLNSLKKEGINKVALVVYSDNAQGNKFWDSQGFIKREDINYRNLSIESNNF